MLDHIIQFALAHWQAIGLAFVYSIVAAISTMPAPGHKVSLYEWFFDWTHTLINSSGAARFRIPIPPVPPSDSQPKI